MSKTPDHVASPSGPWLVTAEIVFGDENPLTEELLGLVEQTQGDVITALYAPAGLFGYMSPACRATLGWDPAELIGLMADDFAWPGKNK